jgi:hypothetical protein
MLYIAIVKPFSAIFYSFVLKTQSFGNGATAMVFRSTGNYQPIEIERAKGIIDENSTMEIEHRDYIPLTAQLFRSIVCADPPIPDNCYDRCGDPQSFGQHKSVI